MSSLEWFAWLLFVWFLNKFMILRFSDLRDCSVSGSEMGAILVSVSLKRGVMFSVLLLD